MHNIVMILFAGYFVALFNLLRMIYQGILIILLIYTIIKLIRKSYKKVIVAGIILFILAIPEAGITYGSYSAKKEASVEFLGDYKLNNLDGEDCVNCKIRLHDNYRYDIYVGDKIVGHGKWEVRSAYDIPGWFFTLDGDNIVRRKNQTIDFIRRE